jgi:predicted acyl esterase
MAAASEVRDGMRVDFDVPIPMSDGLVLKADVFRPIKEGRYAVLLSHGPYAKGLAFQDGYPNAWDIMVRNHPDVPRGSTNKYQSWEVVDPEKWVPDGYACVRVDSRGAGRSQGYLDVWSPLETRDFAECIEWAGVQPWSNGKVGLAGISYYAINQWQVAALQPKHLAAICTWEGFADFYRDATHHGGILSTFFANWYDMQVKTVQHGCGERGKRSRVTGELVCGPELLAEEEMTANRADLGMVTFAHPFDDEYYAARAPDWNKVTVPLLSTGNWGGHGLHLRGNIEGYIQAASKQKWLEVHGGTHWVGFYTDYGVALQKRFFGHFLKGEKNDWDKQPALQLQIRHPGQKFVERHESEWPLARTTWTTLHLDPAERTLGAAAPAEAATVSYDGMGEGVTFMGAPFESETEITGPLAASLHVSSSTCDADLFLVLKLFDPSGKEHVFQGALDPNSPIAQGWLRASHRALDTGKSKPYRPYHAHITKQPLKPGEIVHLHIEIWPTCIVVPKGWRIGLTVQGKDYESANPPARLSTLKKPMTGCGPFLHDDPRDRPPEIFNGRVTIHSVPGRANTLLLPIVPPKAR